MSRTNTGLVITTVALVLATGCGDTTGLHRCLLSGIRELARCGTVSVPENRGTGQGRAIRLRVVVLPARGKSPLPDPVVFITGGPGLAATDESAYASAIFGPLRGRRDIILIDQRGTGESAPLDCHLYDDGSLQSFLIPIFPIERVRACRARLEASADLTQYTSATAADDLADVLTKLGYDRANIYGASYGSRAAFVFLRRHPDRVRTVVVQGVLPPNRSPFVQNVEGTARALRHAMATCAADTTCHRAAPDPERDLSVVMSALRRAPATVTEWNWRRLHDETLTITQRGFAERALSLLYVPSGGTRMLPWVHRAAAGDWRPFTDGALAEGRARRSGRSTGMTLSVLCTEDAPSLASSDTAKAATVSVLGLPIVREVLTACVAWPHGVPADTTPLVSATPVLLLSGALDPVTPPELADTVAAGLSHSKRYIDPTAGHATATEETVRLTTAFIDGAP